MPGELVPDRGKLRASHEDRDRAVERLRIAAGDGRLNADELDERLEAALTARTYGELEALLTDLPAEAEPATTTTKDISRIAVNSATARREGPWTVPQRLEIQCASGSVHLDFTTAVITLPTLEIDASVHSGSVTLVVPPDVHVDLDDVSVSSASVKNRARATTPQVRLRVHVTGEAHQSSITVRHPRRTFWQWLLRRPIPAASQLA
ncbi:DUF1707 domain-containing protein [Actinomadura barringtoniae]|uniref:DUF1707 domain-containing protein n=1 Tax=Actinomadura barringtoniae TaxID=1427535 RepID=A0A939PB00_9ACTN|nr:DUF1707 domain-containing protein [Actinomadura barringtoniae]MBO2449280.1 DUF1707 domain-containing protein [Actinomadura barringtoniae]